MKKVLVANRGEIAVRVIRCLKEMGITSVAAHSQADADSLAAKLADESICIGPALSAQSYLAIPRLMSAVEVTGADAVHPGYGFLSENADFARVCGEYGITFIGPQPQHIEQLGDKVKARQLALRCGVPLLPGCHEPVASIEQAHEVAAEVGYPVIIKAAAGGGGRGMKVVRRPEDLSGLWALASREALANFGCGDCYLERYLERPRHVEVQILADNHGEVCDAGERDCSIQRRHQKLIEEAPGPGLTARQRAEVADYAVRLAKEVGYRSLGTVEFLFDRDAFYFMEVNTRVQVEHPVSELVAGRDLIKDQIRIAMGERISEPRGGHPHSLECRVNAEDPDSFAPWPGLVTAYHEPGGPGVRVDGMLYSGYTVPPHYDSLLAKVITYGADRDECIVRMIRALTEMKVEGIRTNIPFHLRVLRHPDFARGHVGTDFLTRTGLVS